MKYRGEVLRALEDALIRVRVIREGIEDNRLTKEQILGMLVKLDKDVSFAGDRVQLNEEKYGK